MRTNCYLTSKLPALASNAVTATDITLLTFLSHELTFMFKLKNVLTVLSIAFRDNNCRNRKVTEIIKRNTSIIHRLRLTWSLIGIVITQYHPPCFFCSAKSLLTFSQQSSNYQHGCSSLIMKNTTKEDNAKWKSSLFRWGIICVFSIGSVRPKRIATIGR